MVQQPEENVPAQPEPQNQKKQSIKDTLSGLKKDMVKKIDGVIDFVLTSCIISFSVKVEKDMESIHVIADNGSHRIERGQESLTLNKQKYIINNESIPPDLEERCGLDKLEQIIEQPSNPAQLFESGCKILKKHIELEKENINGLLVLWAIATYFAVIFPVFPFIFLFGPKGTGKSNLLELLSYMVFNGQKLTTVTESALCDLTDSMRSTVFIDQAEHLARNLIGLLADSYKLAGGKRMITVRQNGRRFPKEFSGYGPKCFAATNAPDYDLADRGPTISTIAAKQKKKLKFLFGDSKETKDFRGMCYGFLLHCHAKVKKNYESESLSGDNSRKSELWKPLKAVAMALEIEKTEIENIEKIFNLNYGQFIEQPSGLDLVLFHTISDFVKEEEKNQHESFDKTIKEIQTAMKPVLEESGGEDGQVPSPQWIGKRLSRYSLIEKEDKKKKTRDRLMRYKFNMTHVTDIISRYIDIKSNHH
ncbi:hypothetical protein [Desulfobacter sp.]|uniref:hypothetical protein n=1 Tax=Desulfobacter sp. TaxID=2294 RepID=UPI000E8EC686|nr:hypothetical protein [Desulfobacter sp.]HBT88146.1 hypothetical protein [Desulfobacter sp.]